LVVWVLIAVATAAMVVIGFAVDMAFGNEEAPHRLQRSGAFSFDASEPPARPAHRSPRARPRRGRAHLYADAASPCCADPALPVDPEGGTMTAGIPKIGCGALPGPILTPAEHETARGIAKLIASLIDTPIAGGELMAEIDRQFPSATYRVFLFVLTLFEVRRTSKGRLQ
jgi:hypothetical protein